MGTLQNDIQTIGVLVDYRFALNEYDKMYPAIPHGLSWLFHLSWYILILCSLKSCKMNLRQNEMQYYSIVHKMGHVTRMKMFPCIMCMYTLYFMNVKAYRNRMITSQFMCNWRRKFSQLIDLECPGLKIKCYTNDTPTTCSI